MPEKASTLRASICVVGLYFLLCSCSRQQQPIDRSTLTEEQKKQPEYAVSALQLAEGLEATLFAHEPMIANPTNLDVDARGRVWVCEAFNYRSTLNLTNDTLPEGDKIVILEDTNGDGKADDRKVFYQGKDIDAALGVAVFGNKVVVSCSPNVFVFTDENNDDKSDKKELLFTGIGGSQHDHSVHSVIYGPDGKFYFNIGNEGNQILDKDGKPLVDINGNEVNAKGRPFRHGLLLRCDTDGSNMEVIGFNFRNPYEVAIDAYGSLWQSDNDDDGNRGVRINFILEYGNYGFTDELTGAGWRTLRTNIESEIPLRHWHQNDPGSVPNLLQTGAGSPTGMVAYEGELLPEPFRNQVIHADAGPNVVRAYPTKPTGAGYSATILDLMKATDDQWFRPSDICVAPDGSLMVADWYDPTVGGHQMGDQAQGRIYRVAPAGSRYSFKKIKTETPGQAVTALQSPNMAARYLAWTALSQMGTDAEEALRSMLDDQNPRMKARALWLLARLKGRTDEYLTIAANDADENIRITGLRIARSLKAANLADYLTKAAADASPLVRREAAIALRHLPSDKAADIWASLAVQYPAGDRWYLEALGIGADPRSEEFFAAWLAVGGPKNKGAEDIIWRSRADAALPMLAELAANKEGTFADNQRYFRAFDFHSGPAKDDLLANMLTLEHPQADSLRQLALNHISSGRIASDPAVNKMMRGSLAQMKGTSLYFDWVGKYGLRDQRNELVKIYMASPRSGFGPEAVRLVYDFEGIGFFAKQLESKDHQKVFATIEAMTNLWGSEIWDIFKSTALDQKRDISVRKAAIKAYGTGWVQENNLLKMVEANEVPQELQQTAMFTLLNGIKSGIRKVASDMLAGGDDKFGSINELVVLTGDTINGLAMYERVCAACHVVNGKGTPFGPELSEIGGKLPKEGLYKAIMYPDAGVSFGYEGFLIETTKGEKLAGYISSQTGETLELIAMGGAKTTLNKKDIVSKEPLNNSLMPTGLHNAYTKQELVDLAEYLTTLKKASDGQSVQ